MPYVFAWMPGHFELLILLVVVLLLFGNRLPSVARSLGRGIVEFKKGVQGIEEDIDSAASASTKSSKSKDSE